MDVISAYDLSRQETQAPKEIIKGLVTVGYNLLAGTPKAGKSWISLGFALAVAKDTLALEAYKVDTGSVLYAALEDNYHRLKARVNQLTARDKVIPKNLDFTTNMPKLSNEGMEQLHDYLNEKPETKMVILDTLGRISDEKKGDLYAEDYQLGAALQSLAFAHEIAILVVHHSNKASTSKGINRVSGTSGVTAAADTVLVIERKNDKIPKANLFVTGRDTTDQEILLDWKAASGWVAAQSYEPPAWGGY